ncbi:transketolase family protein [Streptomyces sp. OE57]|uniref:transketolase family protein n=1 Tax=Streptomyces lacaronensis TaxID=3379885 RepID=UPI0039B74EE4
MTETKATLTRPSRETESMWQACAPAVAALGAEFPNLVGLGPDSRSIFSEFSCHSPERFIDVGIAESNLVGVAAGLARAGKKAVVASLASFLVRRAAEQIRNDVCNQGMDVTFIGIGGGLACEEFGTSHHVIEDTTVFMTMPHIHVFTPADAPEAIWAVQTAVRTAGPAYVRLGARTDPVIHTTGDRFALGEPEVLRTGTEAVIFANGICVSEALSAAAELSRHGADCAVVNVGSLKPLAAGAIIQAARGKRVAVVVEEHARPGPLAALVSASLLRQSFSGAMTSLAIEPRGVAAGSRGKLLSSFGIDSPSIRDAVLRMLRRGDTPRRPA